MKALLQRWYLEYLNWLKKTHRGPGRIHEHRLQLFRISKRFLVNIEGDRVRYDNYEDWKVVQTLKGKPNWLRRNWDLTKDKQTRTWQFAGVRQGLRWLEVGFRDGYNLQHLAQMGVHVCGIEVNPYAVRNALNLGCEAWEEDIQGRTHFPAREFDVVSACDVLEHCFAPEAALSEIHRILKDDGHVVIEVPFEDEWSGNLMHGHSVLFRNAERTESMFTTAGFCVMKKDLSSGSRNLYLLCKQALQGAQARGA